MGHLNIITQRPLCLLLGFLMSPPDLLSLGGDSGFSQLWLHHLKHGFQGHIILIDVNLVESKRVWRTMQERLYGSSLVLIHLISPHIILTQNTVV